MSRTHYHWQKLAFQLIVCILARWPKEACYTCINGLVGHCCWLNECVLAAMLLSQSLGILASPHPASDAIASLRSMLSSSLSPLFPAISLWLKALSRIHNNNIHHHPFSLTWRLLKFESRVSSIKNGRIRCFLLIQLKLETRVLILETRYSIEHNTLLAYRLSAPLASSHMYRGTPSPA